MARRPRYDLLGRWFHVMNRGIARRVVFRNRADMRFFLALVARAVRRGEILVHDFCLMPTHYHLLVESRCGRLSEAMRRIQNEYVRYFNRSARRDGPLFRGRFRSRPVLSLRYRHILLRYIDHNPVAARIVERPADYPYGAAGLRARGRLPKWLATGWVDEVLAARRETDPLATYETVWGAAPTGAERALVRARIRSAPSPIDDLDDLVGAAAPRVREWMQRKAELADETTLRAPVVDAETVTSVLQRRLADLGSWTWKPARGPSQDLWPVATASLLRELAGLTYVEIGQRLDVPPDLVARRITRHRALLQEPAYSERIATLASECLSIAHPTP